MNGRLLASAAGGLLFGCDGDGTDPPDDAGAPDAGPTEDLLRADCDPLVPEFCGLPLPSNHWLADDATTPTGHRLALGATTLPRAQVRARQPIDPEAINTRDGWSVNASILAYLPGATADGLPSHTDLDVSVTEGAKTVLMNAETGELVPHWSEIDQTTERSQPGTTAPKAFIIRPAVVLEHDTRYLVAIRGVVDADGATIPAPETFAAIRDGGATEGTVAARAPAIEAVLTELEGHGVERADLQLAWDFTTGSLETDTAWMLAARDRAFAAIGDDGPDFEIDSVETFSEGGVDGFRRVEGRMIVPLFLTQQETGPESRLNLDAEGLPTANGTGEFEFVAVIPPSATPENPARPLQYGHGLLGKYSQADSGFRNTWANENGYIPFGVDWIGMAEEDVVPITVALANGTVNDFRIVPERLVQGVVNGLLAMRMMLRGFGDDPMVQVDGMSVVDTTEGYYTGDSQGGIFGGTYMALTTDVTRGILGVPGQPYNVLLNRSVDFDPYRALLATSFRAGVDIQIVLSALQMLWDRAEPGSFTSHIQTDMLPGTPSHAVILQPAIGDYQVTTLGAHIMARAIGAVTLEPQTRPVWGIEEVAPPYTGGSVMVEFLYDVEVPVENIPPPGDDDPHGRPRRQATALAQVHHFLRTGEVIHTCDGICDPE